VACGVDPARIARWHRPGDRARPHGRGGREPWLYTRLLAAVGAANRQATPRPESGRSGAGSGRRPPPGLDRFVPLVGSVVDQAMRRVLRARRSPGPEEVLSPSSPTPRWSAAARRASDPGLARGLVWRTWGRHRQPRRRACRQRLRQSPGRHQPSITTSPTSAARPAGSSPTAAPTSPPPAARRRRRRAPRLLAPAQPRRPDRRRHGHRLRRARV